MKKAANSLYAFVQQAWPILEPTTEFVRGPHIEAVCKHLEAVSAGDIHNLLIEIPPRSSKSTIISVLWPAWEWIHRPSTRFLTASYALNLAIRDALRSRRIITSPWYRQRWGWRFELTGDQNVKSRYENDATGYRLALSVNSGTTGEGGDITCLPYESPLLTEQGWLPIGRVVEDRMPVRVACFDHRAGCVVWAPIRRFYRRSGDGGDSTDIDVRKLLFRIRAGDNELTLTGNHPLYVVGRGYVAAANVKAGDELLACRAPLRSLRPDLYVPRGTGSSRSLPLPFLLQDVPFDLECNGGESGQLRAAHRRMRRLREELSLSPAFARQGCTDVLTGLPSKAVYGQQESAHGSFLYGLRPDRIRPGVSAAEDIPDLLQSHLCGDGTSGSGCRRAKRAIRSRSAHGAVPPRIQLVSQGQGSQARRLLSLVWDLLRGLSEENGACDADSSHRLRQGQQRHEQPHCALQNLSRRPSWRPEVAGAMAEKIDRVAVGSVERIGAAGVVYNIEVEPHHNYFAAGLLVHNCIDDPHNVMEAESLVQRQATIRWHDEAFFNRLNNAKMGRRVVVGQRVHSDDLIGHLVKQGGWEELRIPEEFEAAHVSQTKLWRDWRRQEGELMRPERFGAEQVIEAKKKLGSYAYAAQHQQRPVPREGALFKRHWWVRYHWMHDHYVVAKTGAQIFPQRCKRIVVMDPAGGTSEGADCTAIAVWDITADRKAVLRHAFKERIAVEHIPRKLKEICDVFKPLYGLVEGAFLQSSIVRACRQLPGMSAIKSVDPGGKNKFLRAVPAIVKAEAGELLIPADHQPGFDWLPDWLTEHEQFTGNDDLHDDQVDCTAYMALDMQTGIGAGVMPIGLGEKYQ